MADWEVQRNLGLLVFHIEDFSPRNGKILTYLEVNMYSEEDLNHLIHVFQKDANEARAEAEEYRRKFELCREECRRWKTRFVKEEKDLSLKPVKVKNGKGGYFEAYYDPAREMIFFEWMTVEIARKLGLTINEEVNDES